jgi:hypothetical protein
MVQSTGGLDTWLEKLPSFLPKVIMPEYIRTQASMNLLSRAILNKAYETENGPVTDQAIQDVWNQYGDGIRQKIAQDTGIAAEQVTIDDAREDIIKNIKQQWISENAQDQMKGWRDNFTIVNYVLESVTSANAENIDAEAGAESTAEGETVSTVAPEPVAEPTISPNARPVGYGEGEIKPEDVVLARIDDKVLTLSDLLQFPEFFQFLDQTVILNEAVLQEAARRGIEVDQEEAETKLQEMLDSQGGMENVLSQAPPFIPKSILPEQMRTDTNLSILKETILHLVYLEKNGPITEEKIQKFWDDFGAVVRGQLAPELNTDPESVTYEQAREKTIEVMEQQWTQANSQLEINSLRDNFDSANYLLNIADKDMSTGEVSVPTIEQPAASETNQEGTASEESTDTEGQGGDAPEPGGN